jgi:hypothetical protein
LAEYQPLRDLLRLAVEMKNASGEVPNSVLPEGDVNVGFIGAFGSRSCTPRGLRADFIGNMVMVEGIVTKGFPPVRFRFGQ